MLLQLISNHFDFNFNQSYITSKSVLVVIVVILQTRDSELVIYVLVQLFMKYKAA